jgi:hypothetical protein
MPAKDLTGQRFGLLTVLRPTEQRKHECVVWECRCDCGKTTMLTTNALTTGNTKSCGCYHDICGIINLAGRRFGLLTVQKMLNKKKGNQILWECLCDCGNTVEVAGASLRCGATKSCGCYRRDMRFVDLTGLKVGKLTVLKLSEVNIHHEKAWECHCDCGKTVIVRASSLKAGTTRSCGCLNEVSLEALKKEREKTLIDGTNVHALCQKTRANNTSGRIGVTFDKERAKWSARIVFKKTSYYLGRYADIQDAIRAREVAEEKLHGDFLNWYHNFFLPTIEGSR